MRSGRTRPLAKSFGEPKKAYQRHSCSLTLEVGAQLKALWRVEPLQKGRRGRQLRVTWILTVCNASCSRQVGTHPLSRQGAIWSVVQFVIQGSNVLNLSRLGTIWLLTGNPCRGDWVLHRQSA